MVIRRRAVLAADHAIDHFDDIQRGATAARLEALASVFDIVGSAVANTATFEPFSGSKTYGDVVRKAPSSVRDVVRATQPNISAAARRVADAFDAGVATEPKRVTISRSPTVDGDPEQVVVDHALQYLERSPSHSGVFSEISESISLSTGYPQESVSRYLSRNFVRRGVLIEIPQSDVEPGTPSAAVREAADFLRNLGYQDVRTDVPIPSGGLISAVAYEGAKPIVAAFVVQAGTTTATTVRQEARARALSLDEGTHYVWVTDSYADYYCDVLEGVALASLPVPARIKSGAASKAEPAKSAS